MAQQGQLIVATKLLVSALEEERRAGRERELDLGCGCVGKATGFVFPFCLLLVSQLLCVQLCYVRAVIPFSSW